MPLYDYACDDCGPFRDWQSMAQAEEPAVCPSCDGSAARSVTAPFIANMNPHNRIAHQRNEKSAHEPKQVSRQQLDKVGAKRSQGQSCHHGHGHAHSHSAGRPWMLGH